MNPSSNFYLALRIGGSYTAKHGGWYLDYDKLTDEQKFYLSLANSSSSWIINDTGEITDKKYH